MPGSTVLPRRLLVWALIVLTLAGVGLTAALALGSGGARDAGAGGPTPELSLAGKNQDCDTNPTNFFSSLCLVLHGTQLTVEGVLDNVPALTADTDGDTIAGYNAVQMRFQNSPGLTFNDRPGVAEAVDCAGGVPAQVDTSASDHTVSCTVGPGQNGRTDTGVHFELDYTCTVPGTHTVTLPNGGPPNSHITDESGAAIADGSEIDTLTIRCPKTEMSLSGKNLNCDTNPDTPTPAKCAVPVGAMFTTEAYLDVAAGFPDIDGDTIGGYNGFQIRLLTSPALTLKNRSLQTELGPAGAPFWPDCGIRAESKASPTDYVIGCGIGIGAFGSTYTGKVAEVDYNCTSLGTFSVAMPNGKPPNSHLATEYGAAVPDGNELDTLTINCVPPGENININVTETNVPGKKVGNSCFLIAVDTMQGSPPAPVNQPIDVVSDNNATAVCDGVIGGPLSDSDPDAGQVTVAISSTLRLQYGDIWHAQQVQTDAKHTVDNTKYACDLSVGKCTVNISNVRIAGNGFVNFNDTVTGLPLAGQCVDVAAPLITICDNNVAPGAAGADVDATAGVIHFVRPVGVYTVTYNPVNQPDDRNVKTPLSLPCDLSGTTAATQTCTTKFNFNPAIPFNLKTPTLQNLFLTAQGAKLPPSICQASDDIALFSHELSNAPVSPDPKDPDEMQRIGAFELNVLYDSDLVCVQVLPGEYALDTGMICFPGGGGIGCVTLGKDPPPSDSLELARIIVRPQPELYSLITADQENGVVVQILNSGCNLADLQGHPIKKVGCDDSELTIRWLEGDVNGDCAVDVRDEQLLAFRWGTKLGALLYNDRFDLEPSGQINSDGDIDIKDVQFVYGRHGSTCAMPHPDQPPRNGKLAEP